MFDTRFQRAGPPPAAAGAAGGDELVGLLGSGLAGAVLGGRRIVAPLGEALSRQRRFVVDASHELRTPIAQVHTRAQLIARRAARGQPAAEQRADLDRLIGTTRLLGEVVDNLLSSARLSAPGDRPVAEPVDLARWARRPRSPPRRCARGSGRVRLAVTRERRPYVVQGVPTALRRVLSALLDNALGHTPPGGSIEVWLGVPDERHVELRVRDTGIGFPSADADRIFERFARGSDGDGRRFGLGLALVREVVTGHGGTIAAAGRPGSGATFTLRLLRADPA